MNYEFLVTLVFTLIVIMMVGAGVLLFPITRRLGHFLERRLESEALSGDESRQLRAAVDALSRQLVALQDRQDFTDRLLSGDRGELPPHRLEDRSTGSREAE